MSRRLPSAHQRFLLAPIAAAVLGLTLVACSPDAEPSPEPTQSAEPTPAATTAPEAPAFYPDGTAEENLPLFTAVTEQVWASDEKNSGRAYVDALTDAGFDRTQMQVTKDQTTVGNPAESVQFAVRWGEELCLIGQVGPSTVEPVTAIMDQLPEGRCLIGNTQPIDW